jgi:hypothetical protein
MYEELGALWKLKEEALDKFNNTQHMSDYNRFCNLQDQLKTQIEETRKRDKKNYVKQIHPDTPLNMLWIKVGYISDKPKKELYNHVTYEKTSSLKFLEKISKHAPAKTMIVLDDDTEHTAFEVGEFEICLAMKDSRSAAGYDGMTYGILKGCNKDMKKLFLKVINHYWLDGNTHSKTWHRYLRHQLI